MPNPNAIVSSVVRVERDTVESGNQRRVRFDPERSDTRNLDPILEGLSKPRKPVYRENDPATSAITCLLIPYLTHVVGVQPSEAGLDVELDN